MIRIIFFSLLTLMLSCGNTRPTSTTEPEPEEQTTQTTASCEAGATTKKEGAKVAVRPTTKANAKGENRHTSGKAIGKTSGKADNNSNTAQAEAGDDTSSSEAQALALALAESTTTADATADTTTDIAGLTTEVTTTPIPDASTPAAELGGSLLIPASQASFVEAERRKQRFLPTRRRIDREINKIKFAYKGEVSMGLTASYGTLSSDDTDIMLILDNINAEGTVATVKPFIGYFYRDNNCIGLRFGYQHVGGKIDGANINLGESNDITMSIPYIDMKSNNYSFGLFHRSYAGLDPKGRFGLFAEFELALSTGSSEFAFESGNTINRTYSDNTKLSLSFNPGAAVYIFPNVCATLSFGLGGIQYTSVTQKDADGNKIGSRKASNMKFKLNIAAINIGMTIHLWDKKKK